VISLGGSIVAPKTVDENFVRNFALLIQTIVEADSKRRFIIVVGGGGPARQWQHMYRSICGDKATDDQADWIGIMATRLNAQLIKAVFGSICPDAVVVDPTTVEKWSGHILVAAGWKPGFSSDYDAVLLAEQFNAQVVYNLSNIEKVYTADPRLHAEARPIDYISWNEFQNIVGTVWTSGLQVPFDPVASQHAAALGLTVICAAGKNLATIQALLEGKPFVGTVIGSTREQYVVHTESG
jgi:uridylate kinase